MGSRLARLARRRGSPASLAFAAARAPGKPTYLCDMWLSVSKPFEGTSLVRR